MKTLGVTGLRNLGNTCFMNSALQCLSNALPLTVYLLSNRWVSELNVDNPLGMRGEVATAYAKLVQTLWTHNHPTLGPGTGLGAVAPTHFKETIGRFNSLFAGYYQQDSQELLGFLLDGLHEDLNRVRKKPYTEVPSMEGQPDVLVAKTMWDLHLQRNNSIIVDLFQGQLKSSVKCTHCSNVSVTFDPYMFLSLPVPDRRQRLVRLHAFTKIETLGEEDTWYCPKCQAMRQVHKKLEIWSTPELLVLHLKRFSSGSRHMSSFRAAVGNKIDGLVAAPITGLDLSGKVLQPTLQQEGAVYDLFAVSNHFGSMGGGHYTANAKNALDGHWYNFDDSSTQRIHNIETDIVTSSVYFLFYRR
ncbi:hypothetical protein CXG81DRAFT_12204, partial [Caulochytrium protostelioides]